MFEPWDVVGIARYERPVRDLNDRHCGTRALSGTASLTDLGAFGAFFVGKVTRMQIDGPTLRPEVADELAETWRHLGAPGTWWEGRQRTALAEVARAARHGAAIPATDLGAAATEAAVTIAAHPARTTRAWVEEMVASIGEEPYVELVGVVTRVVVADTVARLLGTEPAPFPPPRPGEPSRVAPEPRPRRIRTWVAIGNVLSPPRTLALVPDEKRRTNRLLQALYMTWADMEDPDFRRGELHRTQIELVAAAVSYANECFY